MGGDALHSKAVGGVNVPIILENGVSYWKEDTRCMSGAAKSSRWRSPSARHTIEGMKCTVVVIISQISRPVRNGLTRIK